jgi:hypothetical protein
LDGGIVSRDARERKAGPHYQGLEGDLMHPHIEEVALYTILLREAALNRHTSQLAATEDIAYDETEFRSFATLLAHANFTELDWELAYLLCEHKEKVRETAHMLYAELEQPLEAEALVHACGPNGNKQAVRSVWARPIRERWEQVRDSIPVWESEWVARSYDEIEKIAKAAFKLESGWSDEKIELIFPEPHRWIDSIDWDYANRRAETLLRNAD